MVGADIISGMKVIYRFIFLLTMLDRCEGSTSSICENGRTQGKVSIEDVLLYLDPRSLFKLQNTLYSVEDSGSTDSLHVRSEEDLEVLVKRNQEINGSAALF
jgi:hypothetical protein